MLSVRKRGRKFHVDFVTGTCRLRGSLATQNQDAARRLVHRLEMAMSEGGGSNLWHELKQVLPFSTYTRFADFVGVKEKRPPTWTDLHESFVADLHQKITLGELSGATAERYGVTIREFEVFLSGKNVSLLEDIDKTLIENFKVWRLERITKRKNSRGGAGLVLDLAILHRIFAVAIDAEMILKNPVRTKGRPGGCPARGAQPFSGTEVAKLREHAGKDLLLFLLLRWTGFRGSDAVKLTWSEVHFDREEIERVTQKRRKRVILPIHSELLFLLEAEYASRRPKPTDRVLLNPATGKQLTRPRLYERMVSLGLRAGVPGAHPHRYRDFWAVDMLARGASPYDVAKGLGDTIETVERHYTPFVRELRERVRTILETGIGIDQPDQVTPQPSQKDEKRPN